MSWPEVSLGEVCKPKQHKTIPKSDLLEAGFVVYGANGPIGYYSDFTHDRTTIAITCRGATCGTINVVPPNSYVTGNAMALDNLDEGRVDLSFLRYALEHKGFEAVINGAAQPQITRAPLLKYTLPLPPLDEQQRIAAILDQADELRRKHQRAIDRLNQLGQAIFHEMFGAFHDDFGGWPIHRLETLVDNAQIGAVRGAKEMGDDKPVEYLRMDSIGIDGGLRLEGLRRIEASEADQAKYRLHQGDLLFNTRNSKELVGKTAVVRSEFRGMYNNNILRVRFDRRMTGNFLDAFLRTRKGSSILSTIKSGTTSVFAIYQKSFLSLEVPVPPMDLQRRYADRLQELFVLQKRQADAAGQSASLFSSLQDHTFQGEL